MKILFTLLCFSFFISCDLKLGPTFNPKEDKLPKPIKNQDMGFKKIKGNVLFVDIKKNIYIKQAIKIPATKYNIESNEDRYFNLIKYKDTIIQLQKIIDVKSFKQIDSFRYEDNNHFYIYNLNSKTPPAFTCVEK